LALASLTGGDRSIGIVRLRTKTTEFFLKDYGRKGSVGKTIFGRESQGSWRQDEMKGGKAPVLK
jgi:hypothetical protein